MKKNNFCYSLLLIVVGYFVFANACFNGFVYDDQIQIVKTPLIHSVKYIPLYFVSSIRNLQKPGILLDFYYKPIMFSFYSILYTLGGGHALLFHVFQVSVHIANALIVFYLFKKILSSPTALFLSLIFLIHPINEEVVAYIASFQDVLFFFFGCSALLLLEYSRKISLPILWLSSGLILLALLSKETGVLFLLILGWYFILFQKRKIQSVFIPILTAVSVYLVLRLIASQFYFLNLLTTPLMKVPISQRLLYIPKIIVFYLRESFFPTVSFTSASATPVRIFTLSEILIPLFYSLLFFLVIIAFGFIILRADRQRFRAYLFYCLWFITGLLFHLQLFPLDTIIAKRWFYFPLVGLLGMAGILLEFLIPKRSKVLYVLVLMGICILFVFGKETIYMNKYWKSAHTFQQNTITF